MPFKRPFYDSETLLLLISIFLIEKLKKANRMEKLDFLKKV